MQVIGQEERELAKLAGIYLPDKQIETKEELRQFLERNGLPVNSTPLEKHFDNSPLLQLVFHIGILTESARIGPETQGIYHKLLILKTFL